MEMATGVDHHAPRLPVDLERDIFEACALSRPVGIPTLMLVAWRVKQWVEPLLYRSITVGYTASIAGYPILTWELFLAVLHSKPPLFFANAVHHLNIFLPRLKLEAADRLSAVLSVCTAVENLGIAFNSDEYEAYAMLEAVAPTLSLRRLYLYSDSLTLTCATPLLSHITHLEVLSLAFGISAELSLLPQLTHLAFCDYALSDCLTVLETCRSLRVIVALTPLLADDLNTAAITHNVGLVCMARASYLKDWQMGVHVGVDFWSRAEDFITRRRSGEIDAQEYRILVDDSELIE
ncbi:hypothetical protein DFH06DRAFT_1255871 [Mycena polygramma]|nr:hypothetical protein DFH06DRAFT_1255871 [Mycena polygramma]